MAGFLETLRALLSGTPDQKALEQALRLLAKQRSNLLENTLTARDGTRITRGPFAGMDYPVRSAEGARLPRLLGAYEHGLAPVIETIIDRDYPLVIDVGSAEGYYAVGLARRMQGTTVWARDANPAAVAACTELARVNDVSDRVLTGGILDHADLAVCAQQPTAIICDIEGAEADLLDPGRAPGLAQADILVEVHETFRAGLTKILTDRFSQTHRITRIDRKLDPDALPAWMEGLSDLDRLLVLWEWRAGPTPWLWMESRKPPKF